MPITREQKATADAQQDSAAHDSASQVRLLAGPGTGKTGTIIKRVLHLLNQGVSPNEIFVITFTRAASKELHERIQKACSDAGSPDFGSQIRTSTMHSLALSIASRAGLNQVGAHPPRLFDDWEQGEIFEKEFGRFLGCTPTRAHEVRMAFDAQWQTLSTTPTRSTPITPAEISGFNSFHAIRVCLYCALLPGEVVHRCVRAFQQGQLNRDNLPPIQHLVVDEFQDLNLCDQEFIRHLASSSSTLFVAGDDDQSIYSFRHANPEGIVQFHTTYPTSSSHTLTECFRCAPSILNPALQLIEINPHRAPKGLNPMYGSATPPVMGSLMVWSFRTQDDEAQAIATSCRDLIENGMAGQEDEIVILLCNQKLQLDVITRELGNLGLQASSPNSGGLTDDKAIRAVYSMLRLLADRIAGKPDYLAHRSLLECLVGVGPTTIDAITSGCLTNHQNFRDLFYLGSNPSWLSGRCSSALSRTSAVIAGLGTWTMTDELAGRGSDISVLLNSSIQQVPPDPTFTVMWDGLVSTLPQSMNLGELLEFLASDTDAGQQGVLEAVNQRIAQASGQPTTAVPLGGPQPKRIRILTMHGAKGLSGKVVFIPTVCQGVLPGQRDLADPGSLIEKRRLFYVSMTRAKAACIISHAARFDGAPAFIVNGRATARPVARPARSQFLTEMGAPSTNRTGGLTPGEAALILNDIENL